MTIVSSNKTVLICNIRVTCGLRTMKLFGRGATGRAVFNNVFPEQYRSFICGIPHTLNPSIRLVNLMKNARKLLQNPKRLPSSAKKRWRHTVKIAVSNRRQSAYKCKKTPTGHGGKVLYRTAASGGFLTPYFVVTQKQYRKNADIPYL